MQYTNYRDALEQEIGQMPGNLDITWKPRTNVELYEDELSRQYDVWLQELADTLYEYCGYPVPLMFDGETVIPAQWLDEDDNFAVENVVCQDNTRLCRSMNQSWYNILHIINLYCATIQQEIGAWWNDKR